MALCYHNAKNNEHGGLGVVFEIADNSILDDIPSLRRKKKGGEMNSFKHHERPVFSCDCVIGGLIARLELLVRPCRSPMLYFAFPDCLNTLPSTKFRGWRRFSQLTAYIMKSVEQILCLGEGLNVKFESHRRKTCAISLCYLEAALDYLCRSDGSVASYSRHFIRRANMTLLDA